MTTLQQRAAALRGLILDVDGVLSDGRLYYSPEGERLKAYHARDGLALVLLREDGVRLGVVSGRQSPTVEHRARELGMEPCILGCKDKAKALEDICELWDCRPSELAAMGDDWVDLPMLRRVGIAAAPGDAHLSVRAAVEVVTEARGGHGAVREFCDLLLRGRDSWPQLRQRYELEDR